MGAAKRRGSFEERKAQAIERKTQEWAIREGMKQQAAKAEAERIRNLPPEERKQVILAAGDASASKHRARMLMAMTAGLAAPLLAIDPSNRVLDGDRTP